MNQPEPLHTMSKEWYEGVWEKEWMDYSRYGPTRRHVRNLVLRLIEPLSFDSVLDIGCGEGSLLREIGRRRAAAQLAGTDVSEMALKYAQQNVPKASFALLDIEHDTLAQRADLTVCVEVLEHIEDDEQAIANLAAMTDRYLVIVVPQGRMRGFEREDVGHVRNYTRADLAAKMRRAGFPPVAVLEWGFPFFSPLYRNFLDRLPGNTVKGKMGWRKRLASEVLYQLFRLNSYRRGDKLAILGARDPQR